MMGVHAAVRLLEEDRLACVRYSQERDTALASQLLKESVSLSNLGTAGVLDLLDCYMVALSDFRRREVVELNVDCLEGLECSSFAQSRDR